MRNPFKRREPYRFECLAPGCDSVFFIVNVSMTRRRNRLPDLGSISGQLTCARCGWKQGYNHHVAISRGWRNKDEVVKDVGYQASVSNQEPVY